MRFKNRYTGEVKDWDFGNWYQMILNPDNKKSYECSLTDFMDRVTKFREEWEDYEEPKEYWFIDRAYEARATNSSFRNIVADQEIGNYFKTEEEAKKAVEKLKAWKRLKDKGFKITFVQDGGCVYLQADWGLLLGDFSDVELLFGGEK